MQRCFTRSGELIETQADAREPAIQIAAEDTRCIWCDGPEVARSTRSRAQRRGTCKRLLAVGPKPPSGLRLIDADCRLRSKQSRALGNEQSVEALDESDVRAPELARTAFSRTHRAFFCRMIIPPAPQLM